jgi:hypothetical protein
MLGHAGVATTLRLYAHVTHASTEALVDAIGARTNRLPRPLGRGIAQDWPGEMEIGAAGTETECRERESNPPKQAKPKHKTGRPYTQRRP